jgi:hypothetical protein
VGGDPERPGRRALGQPEGTGVHRRARHPLRPATPGRPHRPGLGVRRRDARGGPSAPRRPWTRPRCSPRR